MVVQVSALGLLKRYVPEEKNIELSNQSTSLKMLATEVIGIPVTESGVCFVVNGRVQSNTYLANEGDKILIIKMGGAG